MTQLSRLLGETVISDVAIVGSDMFFHEGAAYGFLFEARNNFLLGSDLAAERAARLARGGVAEQKLKIAGQSVSLISSPGRRRAVLLRPERRLSSRSPRRGRWSSSSCGRQGGRLAGGDEGIPPCADDHAPGAQRHGVRLFLRRLFPQLHQPAIPGGNDAAAGGGRRHRVGAVGRLGRGGRREAGRRRIEQLIAGGLLPADFGPRPDGSRAVMTAARSTISFAAGGGDAAGPRRAGRAASPRRRRPPTRKFADFYRSQVGPARSDDDRPEAQGPARASASGSAIDLRMTPLDRRPFRLPLAMGRRGREDPPGGRAGRRGRRRSDAAQTSAALRRPARRRRADATSSAGSRARLASGFRDVLVGYCRRATARPGFLLNLLDATFLRAARRGRLFGQSRWDCGGGSSISSPSIPSSRTCWPPSRRNSASRSRRTTARSGCAIGDVLQARVAADAEQLGLLPHAGDGPGRSSPAARLESAVARAAGRLQGDGRVAAWRRS